MFCPKCGTQNPEDGKFCRSCGTDLASVSAALTGALPAHLADAGVAQIHHEARRRNDPNEVYADAVKAIISGIGFLVVSMVLLFTGVAGGYAWWWAMLFPAFTFLSKGISDYVKYGKMQSTSKIHAADLNMMGAGRANSALPPTQTEYIAPSESSYKTGDLVPPSVTDSTTRHLEMDPEGKTMTLPKR